MEGRFAPLPVSFAYLEEVFVKHKYIQFFKEGR